MLSLVTQTLIATFLVAQVALAFEVAAYWGQNSGYPATPQTALKDYCDSNTADIIVVSFINKINPLNINLANICGTEFDSGLLHCPSVGDDISYCQSQGKKVLLSVGGATGAKFASDKEATEFATNVWNKFGGGSDEERPFDAAVVDGFDLDFESKDQTGTVAFGNTLRALYGKQSAKQYYLSASPQCVYPDESLNSYLTQVSLDYTFVQFYNNQCKLDGDFNFKAWSDYVQKASPNKNNKLFVGLPGTPASAPAGGYVSLDTVKKTVDSIKCDSHFGGLAVWDASSSFSGYAQGLRQILDTVDTEECRTTTSTTSKATTAPTTAPTTQPKPTTPATTQPAPTTPATIEPSAPYGNSTSTKTDIHTTVITITSCDDHKCTKVPVTTGLTTVTELDTVYTTYCPLLDATATETALSTTLVTVTECADNECTAKTTETAAPTETEAPETKAPETEASVSSSPSVAPVPTTAPANTASFSIPDTYTTLTSYVTEQKPSFTAPATNGSSPAAPTAITAYENMATSVKGSLVLIGLSALAALF